MHLHEHGHEVTDHIFEHVFSHSIQDTWSLIPFLFLVFLVLEHLEHSMSSQNLAIIEKAGRKGPLFGGILGALPQCGFSVMATNLFAGRLISIGTIIAVYLSTSDEMLAVMLSSGTSPVKIIKIILIKILIAIAAGFGVDFVHRAQRKYHQRKHHHHEYHHEHSEHHGYKNDFCVEEECHCDHESPVISALKHTIKIYLVIFFVTFLLNLVIDLAGLEIIAEVVSKAGAWAPIVSSVVGMIPNCASSVAITQLYLSGAIDFGTAIAGLLTGSGIAWVVLFRVNPHSRQNFKIMGVVFLVGALSGILFNMLEVAI